MGFFSKVFDVVKIGILGPTLAVAAWTLDWAFKTLMPDFPSPNSPAPELQLTQNKIGAIIPDLLGTGKLNGTLLFFGHEWKKKRGSGGRKRYWYFMTWGVGYCVGPVDTIYTIFSDDKVLWSGTLDNPVSGGKATISIKGFTHSGYHSGEMIIFFGTDDQVADSDLVTYGIVDSTLNTPYRGLFWILFKNCKIGVNSKRMPSIRVVARKAPVLAFNSNNEIDTYDYNPIHALWYILENMTGLPASWLHTSDFSDAADDLNVTGITSQDTVWTSKTPVVASVEINGVAVFNDEIYGVTNKVKLLKWDGISAWSTVAPEKHPTYTTFQGQVLVVYGGKLYAGGGYRSLWEWNGVDDWTQVAPLLAGSIHALIVFEGDLYGGAANGSLYRWNGINAWATVAPHLNAKWIYCLCEYNGKIYGGTNGAIICGQLYEWNAVNAWVEVAPRYDADSNGINALVVYNSKLYGAGDGGQLLQWNDVDAWVSVAPQLGTEYILSLIVYRNCLYGGTYASGNLYRWNDVDAWVQVAPRIGSVGGVSDMLVHDGKIFAGASNNQLLQWEQILYDYTLGLSIIFNKQQSALSYLKTINAHINNVLRYGNDGKFHPKLIRDDYTVSNLLSIDEGLLLDEPSFRRKSWIDTINEVKVQYSFLDRDADIIDLRQSSASPVAVDLGNKEIQGRVVSKSLNFASFTMNKNAVWIGRGTLLEGSYPLAAITLKVNRNAFRLEVGDCFKLSYGKYSVSNMVCRVMQIEEKALDSEDIIIHSVEDIFAVGHAVTSYEAVIDESVDLPDYTIAHFTNQQVIETPYTLLEDKLELSVIPMACRKSSFDLGFETNLSVDNGTSYSVIDDTENLFPYGTITNEYSISEFTIDNSSTGITIDFIQDASLIEDIAFAQTLTGVINIALLGTGQNAEFIFFQNIELISGSQYKITNIIRGRFDTEKQTHAASTSFYFLGSKDEFERITSVDIQAGANRDFKLNPYNEILYGVIADATNIDIDIEGRGFKPYKPVNFIANDGGYAARYTTDIVLGWAPRLRGDGAGLGIPGTILANTDREGFFEVEVWVSDVLERTTTAIDATTWTYTESMNITDNGSLASEVVFKLLNYRVDAGITYESDQATVTCKKTVT